MSDGQNGGNCFDAMRQKIKNPAPLRSSQLTKLLRDGAGFLNYRLMASKQFPPIRNVHVLSNNTVCYRILKKMNRVLFVLQRKKPFSWRSFWGVHCVVFLCPFRLNFRGNILTQNCPKFNIIRGFSPVYRNHMILTGQADACRSRLRIRNYFFFS